jgi:TRAP-type C4-dicarboxylate transport system permease small subunit
MEAPLPSPTGQPEIVRRPPGGPRWLSNASRHVARGLQLFAQTCVIVMMLLIIADVSGRYLLGRPVQGAYIFNEAYLMPAIVFFGMAAAYRQHRHIAVTFVLIRLPRALARAVHAIGLVAVVGVVGALMWATVLDAYQSWARMETLLGAIKWPRYIARTIPPVGLAALWLAMVADLVGWAFGAAAQRRGSAT